MTSHAYCARCKKSVAVAVGTGTTRTCKECGRAWGSPRQPRANQ